MKVVAHLRVWVVAGKVILEIAQRRRAGFVEPLLHSREVSHGRRVWQIVRHRPDAGEQWYQVCLRIRACEPDGRRRWPRLASQECGLEIEKSDDECFAIAQRGPLDEPDLKVHSGFTEQPRLALQPADERRQVALVDRAHDLLHEKRLPRSGGCGANEGQRSLFDQILDEGEAARAAVDVLSEFGIERDGSLQQE